jgi:hypothetical protein
MLITANRMIGRAKLFFLSLLNAKRLAMKNEVFKSV